MAEYITLLGAEQVQSAANTIRSAADEMSRAASSIDNALHTHRMFMDDWLMRYQLVMEEDRAERQRHEAAKAEKDE